MRPTQPWHRSRFGSFALWMGSIQLAIPILILVAAAMIAGTYIESTQSGKTARALVYGSPWFIALMAATCLSLIFAVITRYPWKRRHTGFMIVHASLVALIASGFWSMFGRVEGRMALEQGHAGSSIEGDHDVLELVEHQSGQFQVLGAITAPTSKGPISLAGHTFNVTEVWANTHEDFEVVDGGPQPYRAVEISLDPGSKSGFWIGDEAVGGAARTEGLVIRLLGADSTWELPAAVAPSEDPQPSFVVGEQRYPLPADGQEAFPGWTVTSRKSFANARVVADGIVEATGQSDNPAVDVVITDGKGSTERHTAFKNFPDMVVSKTVEGETHSGARLMWGESPRVAGDETLILFGALGELQAAYIAPNGAAHMLGGSNGLPWSFDAGRRRITILHELSHAQERSKLTQIESGADRRPALVIGVGSSGTAQPLGWKSMLPVELPGINSMLRFGPQSVTLPFTLKLEQFRKTDYPGTDMAMAYESSVTVSSPEAPDSLVTISMNNPLVQSGWKVYQSGYEGERISVFSVMRDPGLTLTYFACASLCIGICITFYGRGFGKGHPGIPSPFARKESSNVAHHAPPVLDAHSLIARDRQPALAAVDGSDEHDPHSGRRPRHAAGVLRQ